jgi:tetratricopeptide (TPR) repeat protein
MRWLVMSVAWLAWSSASAQPSPSASEDAVVASMVLPAVTQRQRSTEPARVRGHLAVTSGDWQAAVQLFELAVEEEAGSLRALRSLGYAHAFGSDLDAAHEALYRAASIDPSHAPTIEMLAVVRYRQADYEGALSMFERLSRLQPDGAGAWLGLGRAALMAASPDKALEPLERAIALGENAAVEPYVEALKQLGRRREARQIARQYSRR